MRQQARAGVGERQDPPLRSAGRERRGGKTKDQKQDDEPGDEFRHQPVDGRRRQARHQQLADQPHRQDRHQHQAEAIDGGGDGAVVLIEVVGAAASEAATQFAAGPPQDDGDRRPNRQPDEAASVRTQCRESVVAPGRQSRRQCPDRIGEFRTELGPDVARQRRGVATHQRLQHHFAAQFRQPVEQLVGAGDHDLTLLQPSLTDRCLLGQALAFGLHGIRLGGGIGPRLGLERGQKLLGVGKVVAGERGGSGGGGAHIGGLFAQRVDLGRQEACLLCAGGDPVELTRPQVDELGEWPLRRRGRLGERGSAHQQEHEARETGPGEAGGRSHSVVESWWLRRVFVFRTTADADRATRGEDGRRAWIWAWIS